MTISHFFINRPIFASVLSIAIVILGGLGSFPGAFIGALILGVTEGLTGFVFTSQVSEIASYLLIISVLLLRPTGILGLRR
mgnify:CR=1 FL=1